MQNKTDIVKGAFSLPTLGNPGFWGGSNIAVIVLERKYTLTVSLNNGPEGQQHNTYLHFLQQNLALKMYKL